MEKEGWYTYIKELGTPKMRGAYFTGLVRAFAHVPEIFHELQQALLHDETYAVPRHGGVVIEAIFREGHIRGHAPVLRQ